MAQEKGRSMSEKVCPRCREKFQDTPLSGSFCPDCDVSNVSKTIGREAAEGLVSGYRDCGVLLRKWTNQG